MKLKVILLGLAAAAIVAPLYAADNAELMNQTFNTVVGPTGLITVPSAYVVEAKQLSLSTTIADDNTFAANYGVMNGVELGACFVNAESGVDKTIFNAKVHVIPANFKGFELGLGVLDASNEVQRSYYVMASANMASAENLRRRGIAGLRLHAGVGSGRWGDHFIGGAEVVLNGHFSIVTEYDSNDVNVAARYIHGNGFGLQTGLLNTDAFVSTTYTLKF